MMELFLNATSPYARLVRVVVLEKDLAEAVTLRWCDPWADEAALLDANPAGRIPALTTEDGSTLSESILIAVYLDGLGDRAPLIPDACRAFVLHLAGLGQALMDTAFTTVINRKHHGHQADDSLLGQRRWRAIQRLLSRLDNELADKAGASVTLGDIAVAVALEYLTFRLPETAWQEHWPGLAAWHHNMAKRHSIARTAFQ
ncbi:MAG: glutathione S-transferase N-terminal domain-containing protein [Halomonas sp.]|nr:glutathione S-transferase N-terminal domain-containing protein [Halomonas sp.]MDN6297774.1 glutathione S-transferase N-terminal domain-containing protein [Halomonas sp.]MDN6315141.1 glutathione S-transferase N-terminal domain-containing protein [Halomonas sp.]MDN6336560.1 glutathione S-transferase N-terminal domain-containing protein [Halomonas sp.]